MVRNSHTSPWKTTRRLSSFLRHSYQNLLVLTDEKDKGKQSIEMDMESEEDTIIIEGDEDIIPTKRGRRRPPTTGEYYKKQEREERIKKLRQEQDEREQLGFLDGSVEIPNPTPTKVIQR